MPPFKHNGGFEDHAWLSLKQNCHSQYYVIARYEAISFKTERLF